MNDTETSALQRAMATGKPVLVYQHLDDDGYDIGWTYALPNGQLKYLDDPRGVLPGLITCLEMNDPNYIMEQTI